MQLHACSQAVDDLCQHANLAVPFPCRLSPLSQAVTLRELREGAGKTLGESLRMEFRMVTSSSS